MAPNKRNYKSGGRTESVSARTLALRGFFPFVFILTRFFLRIFNFSCLAPWIWRFNRLTGCPPGAGKNVSHTMDLVCQVYVQTSSDDSRVDGNMCAGSPSLSRLFFEDGAMAQWIVRVISVC